MRRAPRRRQRGAVAIIVGLTLAVLIGAVGLALDGGRLYLTKTETQNAADACALSASFELTGAPNIPLANFAVAEAAGQTAATRNRVNFQTENIEDGDVTVEFGTSLNGGSWASAGSATADSRYVRCTIAETGIIPWFMQVLGFGAQTVRSMATASLEPSDVSCPMPMSLCAKPGGNHDNKWNFEVGEWIRLDYSEQGPNINYAGNFRWVDFTPGSKTPGCSGNGAAELGCILKGPPPGTCTAPQPITGSCTGSGSSNQLPGCIGEVGSKVGLIDEYNSRFGVYKGGTLDASSAPPDRTGYAYAWELKNPLDPTEGYVGNWPLGKNAYAGTVAGVPNYQQQVSNFTPASNWPTLSTPFFANPPYSASPKSTHQEINKTRRLITVPIVDCSEFDGSGHHAPVRDYACVLMLDTFRKDSGNKVLSKLEFIGLAGDDGTPCATSGTPGTSTSLGPRVPALVQ
jgi:hypothetical protein